MLLRHVKINQPLFARVMATPRTPENGVVPYAWSLNSPPGLEATTCIKAEKVAEEAKMDYNIIKVLSAERRLNKKRMQMQCSALVKKFKEESWMFADDGAL